jgi:glutamine synthetase
VSEGQQAGAGELAGAEEQAGTRELAGADDLIALVCCDLGAIVRGRAVRTSELDEYLNAGVGWVPANHALTPLGPVADPNPFGSTGDLRLLPDVGTRVLVESDSTSSAMELVLCDIAETDGRPWECCPRSFLRETLLELERELGARLVASFEHEFQLLGPGDPGWAPPTTDSSVPAPSSSSPALPGLPFSLQALRQAEPFPRQAMRALAQAGVEPERVFAEYAPRQLEIPVAATEGIASADRAVVLREVVRELARRQGLRASFAPLLDPGQAGNGVHIHLSLLDTNGSPLLYDADRPACLSELGGHFAAGILRHASALSALTAASPVSGARLQPHRWSAGAVCLAQCNREALLRIPPLVKLADTDPAHQLHLEYRGADATANPHLALAAILRAGLEGVRGRLPTPPMLDRDPAQLDAEEAERFGVGALPATLEHALQALADDDTAHGWMTPLLYDAYTSVKQAELDAARDVDLEELCRRYAAIY